jgi:hypothetical protein
MVYLPFDGTFEEKNARRPPQWKEMAHVRYQCLRRENSSVRIGSEVCVGWNRIIVSGILRLHSNNINYFCRETNFRMALSIKGILLLAKLAEEQRNIMVSFWRPMRLGAPTKI